MKAERKELIKKFKEIITDLLDNYEKYTESERKQLRDLFNKAVELNKILDKYDVERKTNWLEFLEVSNKYFNNMDY